MNYKKDGATHLFYVGPEARKLSRVSPHEALIQTGTSRNQSGESECGADWDRNLMKLIR